MTDKELLYIEDAINHELYMIETCSDVESNVENDVLKKLANKVQKKYKDILKSIFELL